MGQVDKIERESSLKKTLLNNDLLGWEEKGTEKRIPKVGSAENMRNSKKAGAAKRRQWWETRLEGCCLSGESRNLNFTPSWAATARF